MHRIIFHIDVNSAFLSWSAVDRLEHGETLDIRTIPAIIGGDSATRHGVVLAKSVPAKAYKIVTGEPVANALRKCPTLIWFRRIMPCTREKAMHLWNCYIPTPMISSSFP